MILGIDTSLGSAVAVVELDGVVRSQVESADPRGHAEVIGSLIEQALAEASASPADITHVAAGMGPGPFTGLRVGLVTAASMGQALGIPTYGVCSLDALGRAAGPGRVLVATDARRREVYFATYSDGHRTTDPDVARPADVKVDADRAVGEGALTYSEVFGLPIDEILLYPPGVALVAIAADRIRAGAPGERLTPLYLRRPDAVVPASRKPALQ